MSTVFERKSDVTVFEIRGKIPEFPFGPLATFIMLLYHSCFCIYRYIISRILAHN